MSVEGGSLGKFIASRVSRLYPAYWACCTVTFVVILFLGGEYYSATLFQYLVNMTMLHGFVGVDSIDGVYWTLKVELKFYGLVGIVLALRKMHRSENILYCWLVIAGIMTFVEAPKLVRFILIDVYACYFIAGSLFYLLWRDGSSFKKLAGLCGCWVIAVCEIFFDVPANENLKAMGVNEFVVAGIVSLFFVIMYMVADRKLGSFRKLNWIKLGILTYPLYLIHQNIGYILFRKFHEYNEHIVFWGIMGLMLGCSYAVNMWIERKSANLLKNRVRAIISAVIITSIFFLLGSNTMLTQINSRKAKSEEALKRIQSWHNQISHEVPKDMQDEWQNIGSIYPYQLLRGCSIESSESEL